ILLVWLSVAHFGVMALLWLFYDRYALVLLPIAIALFLGGAEHLRTGIAAALIALFAAVSCVGLRDHLAINGALWQAVEELEARGIPPEQIDGGYIVNGWLQYAHPEHAPRDVQGKLVVPQVTIPAFPLRYVVSHERLAGWPVLGTVSYRRWLAPSGTIW